MQDSGFELTATDGLPVRVWRWLPDVPVRGAIQIAHGMGEHAGRYEPVAAALNAAGYAVYAKDHRGHGRTAEPEKLGWLGPDGWNRNLDDARLLTERMAREHPGTPRVLLGHSMGAMLTQQYLYRYGHGLQAAALSGTPGMAHPLQALLSAALAREEAWRLGPDAESPLLQRLLFADANKAFDTDDATGFEWLSRDAGEVRKYVDDPLCGFVLRAGSLVALFTGAREAARTTNIRTIPKRLPLYIFSGEDDPVHNGTKNIDRMLRRYQDSGLHPTYRLYPGGRHELFNETHRDTVLADLISWLEQVLPG